MTEQPTLLDLVPWEDGGNLNPPAVKFSFGCTGCDFTCETLAEADEHAADGWTPITGAGNGTGLWHTGEHWPTWGVVSP